MVSGEARSDSGCRIPPDLGRSPGSAWCPGLAVNGDERVDTQATTGRGSAGADDEAVIASAAFHQRRAGAAVERVGSRAEDARQHLIAGARVKRLILTTLSIQLVADTNSVA